MNLGPLLRSVLLNMKTQLHVSLYGRRMMIKKGNLQLWICRQQSNGPKLDNALLEKIFFWLPAVTLNILLYGFRWVMHYTAPLYTKIERNQWHRVFVLIARQQLLLSKLTQREAAFINGINVVLLWATLRMSCFFFCWQRLWYRFSFQ